MSAEIVASQIYEMMQKRKLFAVFDRDGTLVPINADPDAAILQADVLRLLSQFHNLAGASVAILSARDMQQLLQDFKQNTFSLAGNYGMELLLPKQSLWQEPNAAKARGLLLAVKADLQKTLTAETKVILEDHQLTLCLHWHMSPAHELKRIHTCIKELSAKYPSLLFKSLPTSYEVWPNLKWDKANGLQQLVNMLKIDLASHMVLYIGDSDSDEPAFAWTNQNNGATIRVGDQGETKAQFRLSCQDDVLTFLTSFLALLKKN